MSLRCPIVIVGHAAEEPPFLVAPAAWVLKPNSSHVSESSGLESR